MPDYNSEFFEPPAPIAFVTLRNLENHVEVGNVPMLLDTGADATLIPQIFAEKLGLRLSDAPQFELEAFDKTTSHSAVVQLQMIFEERNFRGEFLLIDQDYGIIGRNILNHLNVRFDGKKYAWKIL